MSTSNQPDTTHSRNSPYAWVVITFCAAFLFYKYAMQVSPSVMAQSLMQKFHITATELGNLAAMFFYSYLIMQLFVGVLLDRFGSRILVSIAILVSATGTFLFSKSETFLHAELSRAMMGLGVAFATVAYMKMTAVWFPPKRFAFIAGLAGTAAMIGAILGQAPLAFLLKTHTWQQSMVFTSVVGFVLAVLFFLVVRDQPKNYKMLASEVEETSNLKTELLTVIKNRQNWYLTFYSGLAFSPLAVFGGLWGNPFLEEAYQISHTDAASLVSLIFIGFAIGCPFLGFLSDKLGERKFIMGISAFLSAVFISTAIYIHLPIWLLGVSLFFFGFFVSAFMLGFAMGRDINRAALAATITAMINTGDAIFGAFSEPLVGKFLDLNWDGKLVDGARYFSVANYQLSLSILPVYILVAIVFIFFIKETRVERTHAN